MHIIFETSIHVDYIIKSSAVNITVFYTYYITDTCKMICEMVLFETLYILFTICLTEFVYLKTSYLYNMGITLSINGKQKRNMKVRIDYCSGTCGTMLACYVQYGTNKE